MQKERFEVQRQDNHNVYQIVVLSTRTSPPYVGCQFDTVIHLMLCMYGNRHSPTNHTIIGQ